MFLFKIKAYIIGTLLSLLPNKIFIKIVNGTSPKIGLDIVSDDHKGISLFKAQIVRINNIDLKDNRIEMVKYFQDNNIEYYIQIGRTEDKLDDIAKEIIESENSLIGYKKPLFYSVVNENNDYSWYNIDIIEQYIRIHHGKPIHITKGSYTSIVESAGLKKYRDHLRYYGIPKDKYHLIHFYLKPYNKINNIIDNILRKLMLRYLIFSLSQYGLPANKIIISESHDASKNTTLVINNHELRPYTEVEGKKDGDIVLKILDKNTLIVERYEGDFVFASEEGWKALESLFKSLGVYAGLYYHAPFLGYKGNTVLKARK